MNSRGDINISNCLNSQYLLNLSKLYALTYCRQKGIIFVTVIQTFDRQVDSECNLINCLKSG